jgi:transcriptional regulator of acetoin/glycerol metabolism
LFDEFKDKMRDRGDDDDAVRRKIEAIIRRLTSTIQSSSDDVEVSDPAGGDHSPSIADFSLEQAAVAREIIDAVEQKSKQLMLLQGSAGTGKTRTVRVILSESQRKHIHCLVSATTGIAAVQYPGGQIVHSVFSLGIDERQNASFT